MAARDTDARIEIVLDVEKETVNTVRFLERDGEVIKRVYVQKADLKTIGSPRAVKLTIEAA